MSINLTLGFDRGEISDGYPILCYERVRLSLSDTDAFDRIKAEAIPLPEGVLWYGDDGLEERHEDEYGDPLTWNSAHRLSLRLSNIQLRGWDASILAFLKTIPETRIILWWC